MTYVRPVKSSKVSIDGVEYWVDKLGRKRSVEQCKLACQNRSQNPMRKRVPRRRFSKDAGGLIKKHAYTADITCIEMAKCLRVSKASIWVILSPKSNRLKPWMIDKLAGFMGLDEEETKKIHVQAALDRGWKVQ